MTKATDINTENLVSKISQSVSILYPSKHYDWLGQVMEVETNKVIPLTVCN